MKKYQGLILIIVCFLGFSHGEENLSGLCRNDSDCTGVNNDCIGYFCYGPKKDVGNPLVSQRKKCTTTEDCKYEGPDMKCMKTHKGKGLCKKSYRGCDTESECNAQKGEEN